MQIQCGSDAASHLWLVYDVSTESETDPVQNK